MKLRDYYHLKKDAFSIDPRVDAEAYFGGGGLVTQIKDRIKSDFVQQRQVPKFCIYGAYGSGKTHTLHHIEYVLRTEFIADFPTEIIELEISPLRAKESWKKVHRDLINAISLERMKNAVTTIFADPDAARDPLGTLQARGILRFGEAAIQSSQAQVFRALVYGGRGEALALEWLKGTVLTMDQAQTIGTETNLTEPSHLIACLLERCEPPLAWPRQAPRCPDRRGRVAREPDQPRLDRGVQVRLPKALRQRQQRARDHRGVPARGRHRGSPRGRLR